MMMQVKKAIGLASVMVLLLVFSATGVWAHTIRVERDGSGQYTTLQPALDAAAAGDTIQIGPGEFPELTYQYLPGNGGWVQVVGYVKDPGLTIIGAGAQATVLGPAVFSREYIGIPFLISGDLTLRGLTVRNCYDGMHIDSGRIFVYDCYFEGNDAGILWYASSSGGGVWNSHFTSTILHSSGVFFLGTGQNIVIEGCTFEASSLVFQNLQGVQVRNCEMFGGGDGVTVESGGSISLEHCRIYDTYGVGVILRPGGVSVSLNDCEVSADLDAINSNGSGNSLIVTNSLITGGSRSVVSLTNMGSASVRHSDLVKGSSAYSIVCIQGQGPVHHDFRGNYWGTTDPAQIDAWILDGHDDPIIRAEVLYTPFATGSTDLVLALAPADSQIVIPDIGGSFVYDASIENNTPADIIADIAIEAVLPDGTVYPVQSFPADTIPAASVYTRTGVTQHVPAGAPSGTYTYRVTASLGDTLLVDSDEFPFEKQGVVAAAARNTDWSLRGWVRAEPRAPMAPPAGFALHAATPNPFNPTTTLAFELPSQEAVSLRVFDLQGRLIRTLLSGETLAQGRHEAVWDGRDGAGRRVSSGTYFYRIEAGVFSQTRRAVLVK